MSALQTDTLVSMTPTTDGSEPDVIVQEIKTSDSAEAPAAENQQPSEPATTQKKEAKTEAPAKSQPVKAEAKTTKEAKKVEPVSPDTKKPAEKTPEVVNTSKAKVETSAEVITAVNSEETPAPQIESGDAEEAMIVIVPHTNTVTESEQAVTTTTVATTEVTPKEKFNLPFSTDWITVFVFIFTALILLVSNRRVIKRATKLAQESSRPVLPALNPTIDVEFEKAKIVAQNRQQWIHALREEISEFVSVTNAIWDLHKIKDGFEDILTDMKDPQFAMKELYQWSCTYNKSVQDTEKLYAKIHLLINPNEENSQLLSSLLDKTMVAVEAKKSPSKLNDEIIAVSQRILKEEWNRVKGFN